MSIEIKEILKRNNLSVTGSREKILSLFFDQPGALAHGDIEKRAGEKFDRVTVYRTLQTFVEKGIIQKAKIFGDFFNERDISEIENALENKAHNEPVLRQVLNNFTIDAYFKGMTTDDLVSALF